MYRPSPRAAGGTPSSSNHLFSRSQDGFSFRRASASSSPDRSPFQTSPYSAVHTPKTSYSPPRTGFSQTTISSQEEQLQNRPQSGTPSSGTWIANPAQNPASSGDAPALDSVPLSSTSPRLSREPYSKLAKEQQSPLRWEHPAVKEVSKRFAQAGFTDLDYRKLVWNGSVLFVFLLSYLTGWYRFLQNALPEQWSWVAYLPFAGAILMALNVYHLLVKFFAPPDTFADYALSPAQRRMLGLNPDTRSLTESQRKFADVIKPRFETKSSPAQRPSPVSPAQRSRDHIPATPSYASARRHPRSQTAVPSPVSPLATYRLTTSPAGMRAEPVRDRRALDDMLAIREHRDGVSTEGGWQEDIGSGASALSIAALSTPAVPKFQVASKTSTPSKVQERIEDGIVVKEPQKTLDEWNVGSYIDEWTENARKWLATKVVKPLARRIELSDYYFSELGLDHLQCGSATMQAGLMAANMAAMEAITASTTGAPNSSLFGSTSVSTQSVDGKYPTLYDISQKLRKNLVVQERLKLENHLTLPEFNCRGYIVERIKILAKGNNLAMYQWNGGSDMEGKPWSNDKQPTDAQLVMHLFCRFMDEMMPGENFATYGNFPFSSKFFIPIGSKPGPSHTIQIRHYTKWPPHFHVVVEGTVYDIYSGRNDVFHTVCLFAHYIREEASGYIGLLNVGGKAVELTSVVEGGPSTGRFSRLSRHRSPPGAGVESESFHRSSMRGSLSQSLAASGSSLGYSLRRY
ncbi:uncharacterized protein SPPG_01168 [Spizellomyces punctatus DAOM BR117]|uniref:Uncharacterized protein n=1 Tax=Spizellomyces punctatus (strain DAOM BR117) TaxID=645134 RepID=A0A0L0HRJ9_SPIPD|nr:uncharacterized protein SPPG_01168 [Spizellomyces punctatus DAOM BR117]KND03703.1 hypothetical protein SPPG_01168 [Spizellomyces punctatus DAOM BR117]|eukprot:XP_016611742.1 hypothetical protein SPPG_01168 [Spizellomyces punctatus DAOM BR117]